MRNRVPTHDTAPLRVVGEAEGARRPIGSARTISETAPEGLPGRLTTTSYTLPEDLAFERWMAIGQTLQQLERSVAFWLGDWWAYGERRWGS